MSLLSRVTTNLTKPRFWVVVCLSWAALLAWSHRNEMDPDGLSYLDMASRAASGDLGALANSYWSPGYPAILSVLLFILRPAPQNLFAAVHVLNFLIYCGIFASFVFFWRSCFAEDDVFLPFSFTLFLSLIGEFSGLGLNTPDLAVDGVVFLSSGLVCRLARASPGEPSLGKWSVMLGAVLASGYYLKAAMLPLSIFLLAFLCIQPPGAFRRTKIFGAAMAFAVFCGPLVAIQSGIAHEFTFGKTGSLNYAWYVSQAKPFWRGGPPDPRVLLDHGPRRLMEEPVLLEFATPFEATHPLWYAPGYWGAGKWPPIQLSDQLRVFLTTGESYYGMAVDMAGLIAGLLVLWIFKRRDAYPTSGSLRWMNFAIAWPVSACAMYAMVHTERRFLSGFFVVFWLVAYRRVVGPLKDRALVAGVLATAAGTMLIPWGAHFGAAAARIVRDGVHPRPSASQSTANLLKTLRLQRGDLLAIAGETFDVSFARLAEMRVGAQIPDEEAFWSMKPEKMTEVCARIEALGIKAIVAKTASERWKTSEWKDLSLSASPDFRVLLITDLQKKLHPPADHPP